MICDINNKFSIFSLSGISYKVIIKSCLFWDLFVDYYVTCVWYIVRCICNIQWHMIELTFLYEIYLLEMISIFVCMFGKMWNKLPNELMNTFILKLFFFVIRLVYSHECNIKSWWKTLDFEWWKIMVYNWMQLVFCYCFYIWTTH